MPFLPLLSMDTLGLRGWRGGSGQVYSREGAAWAVLTLSAGHFRAWVLLPMHSLCWVSQGCIQIGPVLARSVLCTTGSFLCALLF